VNELSNVGRRRSAYNHGVSMQQSPLGFDLSLIDGSGSFGDPPFS
jgi:hypothetical protein